MKEDVVRCKEMIEEKAPEDSVEFYKIAAATLTAAQLTDDTMT